MRPCPTPSAEAPGGGERSANKTTDLGIKLIIKSKALLFSEVNEQHF
jgi:hypothetical protein